MEQDKKLSKKDIAIQNYLLYGYKLDGETVIRPNGKISSCHYDKDGYKALSMKGNVIKLHRLIAYEKFGDELFNYPLVRHLDGNNQNNHPDNLALGTFKDNYHDMTKEQISLMAKKANFNRRKFSSEDINFIRSFKKEKGYIYNLAKSYNVSTGVIWQVINNITYND